MTLAELGGQFKEERLALGLMVEDVAAQLKVPVRILRAIEEGNANDLPHTVYTRGFIKGYALILGHPTEAINEMLDGLEDFNGEDFSPHKTVEAVPLNADESPLRGRGLRVLIKLIILALLAAGGYFYYNHTFRNEDVASLPYTNGSSQSTAAVGENSGLGNGGSSERNTGWANTEGMPQQQEGALPMMVEEATEHEVASVPVTAEVTEPAASSTATPDIQAQNSATPVEQSVSSAQVEAVPPLSSSSPDTSPSGSSEAASMYGTGTMLSSSMPDGMHQIVLTAEAECWVHANADGTVTREFSLQEGETFAMPFRTSLVLRLGNAGGVRIKYDGVEQPRPGTSGQVRTLRFPPEA